MTLFLTVSGLVLFPLLALAIMARAIRRPDRDDHFDNPDHWGAQ